MSGHVFVLFGDLRALACDAWLMPCDIGCAPLGQWLSYPDILPRGVMLPKPPATWSGTGVRTIEWTDWPSGRGGRPWPTHVGSSPRHRGIEWWVEGAEQFVTGAAAAMAGRTPANRRAKPLLALPIVGTGYGGARRSTGEVVNALLPMLWRQAEALDVDIALVTNEAPSFAAAQAARMAVRDDPWPALDPALREQARGLADAALRKELVLFLGAGVGVGAGLPLWGELLGELAASAGMDDDERAALARLGSLDQARVLEGRLGGSRELGEAVARRLDAKYPSIQHFLLASLPVAEVVTTNYDPLFELASIVSYGHTAVLPWQPTGECARWVLKMHGCVNHPEDIVLTRQDYMRYAERRAALAGIVQTLLITRHMLFVGFSLEDENFHRIADEVRKATHSSSGPPQSLGSCAILQANPLMQELWQGDMCWIVCERAGDSLADAARRLEIMLDHLVACATLGQPSHLLDFRYDSILDDDERALRDHLLEFVTQLPAHARSGPAWQRVVQLLGELGYKSGR